MVKITEVKGKKLKKDASPNLHGVKKTTMKKKSEDKQLLGAISPSDTANKLSKSQMRRLRKKLLKQHKKPQAATNSSKNKKKKKPGQVLQTSQNESDNSKQTDGPQYKAFISGLHKRTKSDSIKSVLEAAGVETEAVKVVHGKGKSCAIVKFGSEKSLNDAVALSKKLTLDGKPLTINKFRDRKQNKDKSTNNEGEEGTEESENSEDEVSEDEAEEKADLKTETTDTNISSVQIQPKFKKGEKTSEISKGSITSESTKSVGQKKKRNRGKRKALSGDTEENNSSKNSESSEPIQKKKPVPFPPHGKKRIVKSKKPKGS